MKHDIQTRSVQIANIGAFWLFRKLSNRQFLMVGAVIVGLWAGLTAVVLKVSVHYLVAELAVIGQENQWIYFVAPSIGILLTYLFIRWVLQGDLSKGTSHVLLAIAKKSSFLPRKEAYAHVVTSALTVGTGGSAGLESPIVQTGAAIGSMFASFFPVSYRDRTLLLACGAAAGIATAFNAPIAGVLFALEVLLVDISITAFVPLLIAGATGALCSKVILAEDILLSFKNLSDFDYHNLPYYMILGAACGFISVYYIRVTLSADSFFRKVLKTDYARLIIGSLLLGSLIFLFPALLGEGYTSIKALALFKPDQIFKGSPLHDFFSQSEWILAIAILIIGLVKAFAVSFTINAGGNGGNFAPALFVGGCLGFSFAMLVNLSGITVLPHSHFTLVAMAGVLTGIFHSPLTAIFLIAEITGGYELIIPLMIVAALSTAMSKYMSHSLDEEKLKQGPVSVSLSKDSYVLSGLTIAGFIEKDFVSVRLHTDLRTLVDAVAKSKRNIFPVLDLEDKLVGIISLEDIREIMFNTESYDTVLVNQLMRNPAVTAEVNEDMDSVMEKFDKTGVWNIPVLSNGKYLGFISKSRIFSNYRERLKNE